MQRLWAGNGPVCWNSRVTVFEEDYRVLGQRDGTSGAGERSLRSCRPFVASVFHSEHNGSQWRVLSRGVMWSEVTFTRTALGLSWEYMVRNGAPGKCHPEAQFRGIATWGLEVLGFSRRLLKLTNRVNVTSKTRQSSHNHLKLPQSANLWQEPFPKERNMVIHKRHGRIRGKTSTHRTFLKKELRVWINTEAQTSQKGLLGRRRLELQKLDSEITGNSYTISEFWEAYVRVSTTSNPTRWGHEKLRNRFSPEGGGWRGTGEDQAEVIGGKIPPEGPLEQESCWNCHSRWQSQNMCLCLLFPKKEWVCPRWKLESVFRKTYIYI